MLRKLTLIVAGTASLFLPVSALADSAFKGGATNPGGKYVPYGGSAGKFHTIPVASTFIAVPVASFTLIPVASTYIPVGHARRVDLASGQASTRGRRRTLAFGPIESVF